MTITLDITKAELICAVGQALVEAKRTDEAAAFYRLCEHARDVQEVMRAVPDGLVEYASEGERTPCQ